MDCSMPGLLFITISQSLLKLMSIELMIHSNYLILCHPLLLPSIFPSIRFFSNGSVLHIRWPKYWTFTFNTSLFNEYLGLISFRIDWFDLLAVQGTLKSLLQHHSLKASILQHSGFVMVQLTSVHGYWMWPTFVVQSWSHFYLFEIPRTPGYLVVHYLLVCCVLSLWSVLKFMSSWVSDAIQPSHPLSHPSPPAPNPSQHQGLFRWVSSSHQVAKWLELQL